ncbi:MAG: efflux RND transporter periplasmic adaptor subunit [Cyclobacteriaceae bacterium]|nr:efflux RND transporter periplasmic adaptor subunit [Cyclobacteriaceae bacterium]
MKTLIKLNIWSVIFLLMAACGDPNGLEGKKDELKKLRGKQQEIKQQIESLEKEIAKIDPEFGKANRKSTLVTALPAKQGLFEHFVEVSGSVVSNKNVLISAESMGRVTQVRVAEGMNVSKNQVLVSIDTEIFEKQLKDLETQYELASTLFDRQARLWEKNIGTEMQLLESKTRKESLETQIANLKIQIERAHVKAPFAGTVEKVLTRLGEMASNGTPLVRMVGNSDMYIEADLSEAYVGRFKRGDGVLVHFPAIDMSIESKVRSIGQVINENNRTFRIEAELPRVEATLKPNLIAILRLRDYRHENAVIIPTNLIQKDNIGDYVFIINTEGEEGTATKIHIQRGNTYRSETEVLEGLQGNELLVNDGYREVIDGMKVSIVDAKL